MPPTFELDFSQSSALPDSTASAASGTETAPSHDAVVGADGKVYVKDASGRFAPGTAGHGRPPGIKEAYPRALRKNFRAMLADVYESLDTPPPGWQEQNPDEQWRTINERFFKMLEDNLPSLEGGGVKAGKIYLEALRHFGPKGGAGKGGFRVILFGQGWDPMHRPGTPLVLRSNEGRDLPQPAPDLTTTPVEDPLGAGDERLVEVKE